MREEVHLHAEGDDWRALDALAKRQGMSRSRLAVGLVWEAWKRDIEGIDDSRAAVEARVQAVMTEAVALQDPALTGRLAVVPSPYDAGVPVTVASSLWPVEGRVLDVVARDG